LTLEKKKGENKAIKIGRKNTVEVRGKNGRQRTVTKRRELQNRCSPSSRQPGGKDRSAPPGESHMGRRPTRATYRKKKKSPRGVEFRIVVTCAGRPLAGQSVKEGGGGVELIRKTERDELVLVVRGGRKTGKAKVHILG